MYRINKYTTSIFIFIVFPISDYNCGGKSCENHVFEVRNAELDQDMEEPFIVDVHTSISNLQPDHIWK